MPCTGRVRLKFNVSAYTKIAVCAKICEKRVATDVKNIRGKAVLCVLSVFLIEIQVATCNRNVRQRREHLRNMKGPKKTNEVVEPYFELTAKLSSYM